MASDKLTVCELVVSKRKGACLHFFLPLPGTILAIDGYSLVGAGQGTGVRFEIFRHERRHFTGFDRGAAIRWKL